MAEGVYAVLSGAVAHEVVMDVVSNNVANMSTAGFKSEHLAFREMLGGVVADDATPQSQVELAPPQTDFSQGPIRHTGNPLDVAIVGPGFFSVETGAGTRYTRNGALTVGPGGLLSTQSGEPVAGVSGVIQIPPGAPVQIDESGAVWSGATQIGAVKITAFVDPQELQRDGEGLWAASANAAQIPGFAGQVQPSAVERSNVDPVKSMTDLVWVARSYEIYMRAISMFEAVDEAAATKIVT